MKKLMIVVMAALSISAFGLTAEEAIASKNIDTLRTYLRENGIKTGLAGFLCKSNNISFEDFATIYNSSTNGYPTDLRAEGCQYFSQEQMNSLPYSYYSDTHRYVTHRFNHVLTTFKSQKYAGTWIRANMNNRKHYWSLAYDWCKEDMSKSDKLTELADLAIRLDSAMEDNTLKDILYPRLFNLGSYSLALDLAIAYNDVDKIIDSLLMLKDVTSSQAEKIIEPINAVDSEYRKDEIVKVLKNINSKCTIKLYDNHDEWEPVLAKIRAMIDVRK